jgi:hypothetical protein
MTTHQHLTRDVLLQRLVQVPNIQTMTDDELLALYCESMAAAFQQSIDAKSKQKIADIAPVGPDNDTVFTPENETAET